MGSLTTRKSYGLKGYMLWSHVSGDEWGLEAAASSLPAKRRINEIVLGKHSITADTALRLARYFGTSARFWLGLQADYDLEIATDALGKQIEREVKIYSTVGI